MFAERFWTPIVSYNYDDLVPKLVIMTKIIIFYPFISCSLTSRIFSVAVQTILP